MHYFEPVWEEAKHRLLEETKAILGQTFDNIAQPLWAKVVRVAASIAISEAASLLGLENSGASTEAAESYLLYLRDDGPVGKMLVSAFVQGAKAAGSKMIAVAKEGRDMLTEWAEDFAEIYPV